MPVNILQKQVGRDRNGRFGRGMSGNPGGRPRGSRNAAAMTAEALLEGEAEALSRRAVELAMAGDAAALKLCLERLVAPRRDRAVPFALPEIRGGEDLARAMAAISRGVAEGLVTPLEAGVLAGVVETFVRVIEASEFDRRLKQLEADNARV
jgi:hypothetical protein